ncbi:MAG TPA: hypothetical protein VND98_06395 [Solirubrobacterales bacterium]|nr:hypothetical protein [Solirubrobacterales bacterium]
MRSTRAILAIRYTPVSVAGGVRRAVGGFLRYVQYRDHHTEPERTLSTEDADRFLRYVAHRDQSASKGLLFDRDGEAGDAERRRLATFIERSIAGMPKAPQLGPDGKATDRRRAVYRLVLSPEDARGLDLQRLTRAVVDQLEQDAKAPVHWIAAEHRNTAHPHIHLVIAARREISPGRYQTVMVSRPRLAAMKSALQREIEFQRQHELARISSGARAVAVAAEHLERLLDGPTAGTAVAEHRAPQLGAPSRARRHQQATIAARKHRFVRRQHAERISLRRSRVLARIAARYHREAERLAARAQTGFEREEEQER